MRRLLYFVLLLCGSCWAQSTTTFWLDPDVSTGTHTGTTTNPWQTINWSSINTSLASGPVIVNFSACPQSGCAGVNQTSTAGINIARTQYATVCAGAPCPLTLDGMSFWNPSDATPPATWNTNVAAPLLCKEDAAGCAWPTASKFQITSSLPFGSNATVTNCMGYVTVQGFKFISTGGQIVAAQYLSNFLIENTEGTTGGTPSVGPGYFFGPANQGPGKGGIGCAAQPAGGPDNVTEQYNWVHNTYGECAYIGASTPDPVQVGTPNQVTEDPGLGACMPNCHTGNNYLIQGNVHESCAAALCGNATCGQGDGIDIKDGHTNLRLLNNTIRTTKAGIVPAGNDGQCMVVESATQIDGNYCEGTTFAGATNHDGIVLGEGWDTAPGRGAVTIRNNMIVNETSGTGHNAGFDMFSPNVGSITVTHLYSSVSIQNNSFFKTNDPCVEIESGQTATILVENNIGSNCGGTITGSVTSKDHNDWFSSGTPSGETSTITTDPKYVSTTLPGVDVNFKLQAGSGAIGTGANLSASFTTDYFGTTRTVPWNMGFWQAAGASAATQPSCIPGTGAYGSNQTVACANPNSGTTVMCFTTNGVTPATNGLGTACTTGTVYTAPFSVGTLTLKVVAGTSTLTDSTVASYAYTITVATPALPLLWVNNNEGNSNYTYQLTFPGTWISSVPAGWPTVLPYASTAVGLQQAILDLESYRTSTGKGTRMDIPAGFLSSAANGPYIPQTNTVAATQTNVIDSTDDPNLVNGHTVCAHGIQDNLATSADPGLHNPSCDGLNMYDELGPQNVGGFITGITTLSSHTTTLAAITPTGSAQLVALANGYDSPGNSYVVDTSTNAETVVGVSCINQTGLCANFLKSHASGVAVTYDVGTIMLANGSLVHTSDYNDVQHMWTSECTAANCSSLRFCSPVGGGTTSQPVPACGSGTLAPDHWLIMDMEARPIATFLFGSTPTPILMTGSGSETTGGQYPSHIHFRKDWIHSDWTSLAAGLNPLGNYMYLNGSYISILDTQTSEGARPGNESHSILMEGIGPYKLNHNWIEGQGIGMFSGGPGGTLPITLQQIFQDVEARRYYMGRNFTWLGGNLNGNPHFIGNSTTFKNLNEIKNGQRIVHDGFIWANTDGSGGQLGPLGDVNDRNCSNPSSTCQNYNTIITDVTFSNGIQRNSCIGMEFDRSNLALGNGNGVAYAVYRSTLRNLLMYSISGHNPGCSIGGGIRGMALSNGSRTLWQGTITGNGTTATFVANCSASQGGCPGHIASIAVNNPGTGCVAGAPPANSIAFSAPNISGGTQAAGTYACTGGALSAVTLTAGGTGYTSAPSATLATGTGTVTVTMNGAAVPPSIGAEVLDIKVGDPVPITECNVTPAFNNVTTSSNGGFINPSQRAPLATVASLSWNGTPSAGNLTVSFPSTVIGSDNGGFCTLSGLQGGPFNFVLQHVTQITDNTGPALTSNNSPSGGFNFQMNSAILDNILLGGNGWLGGSVTEGTQTENLNYDPTTMSAHHLVWPAAVASNYTEYGNNPLFPDASGCTGVGCHNPVTMYFPANTFCSGSSATSACIGFAGAMSASAMPITLPDYHNFALHSSSLFKSGGTQQASDGTDMGANISAIDAAQTLNQYVCATACGSGPFPDVIQSASAPCVVCMISKADVPGILEAEAESFWNSSLRLK